MEIQKYKIFIKYRSELITYTFSILIRMRYVSWAPNQHIKMISGGSCDTEDWSIGLLKIQLCIHWNKRHFKIEKNYVKLWYYCNILLFLLWYKVHIYTSKMTFFNRIVMFGENIYKFLTDQFIWEATLHEIWRQHSISFHVEWKFK